MVLCTNGQLKTLKFNFGSGDREEPRTAQGTAQQNNLYRVGWGAPGSGSSATPDRHARTPVASYWCEPCPTKNKFNIEVDTWPTYQILN